MRQFVVLVYTGATPVRHPIWQFADMCGMLYKAEKVSYCFVV